MSEHKARERREARLAEERKERNGMVAVMACVLAAGAMAGEPGVLGTPEDAEFFVQRARLILDAAHKEPALSVRRDTLESEQKK